MPEVTNTSRSSWPYSLSTCGLQLLAQHGHALRQGVAVLAALDGVDGRLADRLGHVEVGLADREVDRVLQLRRQVEHLADARGVEQSGAVGKPVGGHGFSVFDYLDFPLCPIAIALNPALVL